MPSEQNNLRDLAIAVGEIVCGLFVLMLFWGNKHFILSDPDTSYRKETGVITGAMLKNKPGEIGGGEMQKDDYVTFDVFRGKRFICRGEAKISNYMSKKLEVDDEIDALVGSGHCLARMDERWKGVDQYQMWFWAILMIGLFGHAGYTLRKAFKMS